MKFMIVEARRTIRYSYNKNGELCMLKGMQILSPKQLKELSHGVPKDFWVGGVATTIYRQATKCPRISDNR